MYFKAEELCTKMTLPFHTGIFVTKTIIEYTVAAKVVIYCPMGFENYPLDLQYCPFQVGSYGHNESYMSFKLESLTRDDQQSISVLGYKTRVLSLPQQHQLWRSKRGNFTMT